MHNLEKSWGTRNLEIFGGTCDMEKKNTQSVTRALVVSVERAFTAHEGASGHPPPPQPSFGVRVAVPLHSCTLRTLLLGLAIMGLNLKVRTCTVINSVHIAIHIQYYKYHDVTTAVAERNA